MKETSRRSENLSILDDLFEGCQIIDKEWKYVYLNKVAIEHARKNLDELVGVSMTEAYPGIENTEMYAALERVMKDRQGERFTNEFTYPEGLAGWFELHIQPYDDGILVLSRDITELKRAHEVTKLQLKRLDTLRHIDLAITSSLDIHVVADILLDRITDILDVDAAVLLNFEQDSLWLKILHQRGFNTPPKSNPVLKLGEGVVGRVALERETAVIDDLRKDGRFLRKGAAAAEGFVSYFAAPLVSKGELLGVVELFHRERKAYDLDWLEFFEILAGQTAIAISHIRNLGNLQRANSGLSLAYDRTIEGWAKALEVRDIETKGHSKRVTLLTDQLASSMSYKESELVHLRRGAMLHDIGKIGIPDSILFKPGKLTDEEWNVMRTHPQIAYDLLSTIDFLKPALDIPRYHHEKWDGSGYPRGLESDLIPQAARIFAVVDVYDALSSDRPYRKHWKKDRVLEFIRAQSGVHFDPEVVEKFLKIMA